jgi:hypothetical protein
LEDKGEARGVSLTAFGTKASKAKVNRSLRLFYTPAHSRPKYTILSNIVDLEHIYGICDIVIL